MGCTSPQQKVDRNQIALQNETEQRPQVQLSTKVDKPIETPNIYDSHKKSNSNEDLSTSAMTKGIASHDKLIKKNRQSPNQSSEQRYAQLSLDEVKEMRINKEWGHKKTSKYGLNFPYRQLSMFKQKHINLKIVSPQAKQLARRLF